MKGDKIMMLEEWARKLVELFPDGRNVFEIGAGVGNITELLAKKSRSVRSFEIDRELYAMALKRLRGLTNVRLVNGDAFKARVNPDETIFASLPYSRSREFIEWIAGQKFNDAYVVLQREFVEKLMTGPGSERYTAVSVVFQALFSTETLLSIPPEAFMPRPRVFSYYIRISRVSEVLITKNTFMTIQGLMSRKKRNAEGFKVFQLSPSEVVRIAMGAL